MKKTLLLTIVVLFSFVAGYSQSQLWTKTSDAKVGILDKVKRDSSPNEYQLFQLDLQALKSQLATAPSKESGNISQLVLHFPNAAGKLENFRIYESSVLEPELAARHPELKSYVGQGVDNPGASIYFSTTIFGLHTVTRSANGTSYIDPYTKDLQNYIIFNRSSRTQPRQFGCQVNDDTTAGRVDEGDFSNVTFANDGLLRTYRLAMACTVQYAAFHINAAGMNSGTLAQKKAAVLAAMGVSVVRLNSVYEREMSLRMVLVANNENVIYVGNDNEDPFTNSPEMINEIQPIMDAGIGVGNYDIGHGFCTTDSGIAQLSSVCGTGKARGITGQPNPVGDTFDIDYVAHEMGHQFGATHTQNNACNRSPGTAVEPGSGSTIMGYAGICAPDVQGHSDDYFHAVSLAQMVAFVTSGGTCSVNAPNGNTPPVITPLTNYTIPVGTPFVLKGSATDANGDTLTYCWEQTNAGATTAVPSATSTASNPNFRSVAPSTSPNRYFPSLTSAASPWEVLPTVARTLNFALTVRDNRSPNGGQTARQNMTVALSTASGAFSVTSQATDGISYTQNTTQAVTWNAGGTAAAPFNVSNVNILLSTDGGLTYPTVLVANTPNDGNQTVTIPNIAAPYCRIMVESIGNIFYALNTKPFAIGYIVSTVCNTFTNSTVVAIPDGPNPSAPEAGPTLVSTINIPNVETITDIDVNVNVTHSWIRDLISKVKHPDGTEIVLGSRICNGQPGYNITFNDGSPVVACPSAPAVTTGTFAPAQALSGLNGKTTAGNWQLLINDYFQVDTGNLNSWSITVCYATATLSTPNFGLADFKIYPNPNNGNFTVQFNSDSSNEIKVGVHDIRGRLIFDNSYQNTGVFNESLKLNNVQAGMYIVTVQDGDKKEVKKIVVE